MRIRTIFIWLCQLCILMAFLGVTECLTAYAQGNVGIGTTSPDASALLDLTSTSKGLLIPRMTQSQRNSISSPATGLLVYCTDSVSSTNPIDYYYYTGSAWVPLLSRSQGWSVTGNSGTSASSNFLGTIDSVDMVVRTNNTERMRVYAGGNVGLTNNGSTAEELRFFEPSASGTNYTGFKAGTQTTNVTYTLPTAAPTSSGQVLSSTTGGTLSWVSNNGTTSSYGATGANYISKTTMNVTSNSTSAMYVPGLSFPIGAGEVWSFRIECSEGSGSNTNGASGYYAGLTLPSGATVEAEIEGLRDLAANGHETFSRITSGGTLYGPAFNQVKTNDTASGILMYGTVDNSNGVAGTVQMIFASAAATDSQVIYKGAFCVAWKYATVTSFDTIYSSAGTYHHVVPSGVTTMYVAGYGASGGGGGGGAKTASGANTGAGGGGAGGAGEYFSSTAITVVPGENLTIVIGSGGSAGSGGLTNGTAATDGGSGGACTITGSSSGLIFTANGGNGGTHAANSNGTSNTSGGAAGTGGSIASTPSGTYAGNDGAAGSSGSNSVTTASSGGKGPGNLNVGGSGGTGFGSANGTGAGGAGSSGSSGFLELSD